MKQVGFRQKKIVRPRQSIQKSLIEAERVKREETYGRLKEKLHGRKRQKKSRVR